MAETPRINRVVRQDFINTNVPQAFAGGSAAPPVKNKETQVMAEALNRLIKTVTPIAAEAHKDYTKEEMERGLARMHRATPEEIEKMRQGVTNKIIDPNDNPYYTEGVDRGLLQHFGRRFGERALLDWRKSGAYNSSDPNAFSQWMQEYQSQFYQDNNINGFAPDLINEELVPAINSTANIVQQRHQEKQVKDYKEGAELQFQQENMEVIGEAIRSQPTRKLLKQLELNGEAHINSFSKRIQPKIDNLSKLLISLGKKQNKGIKISKRTPELVSLSTLVHEMSKDKSLNGTPLYTRILALDKEITRQHRRHVDVGPAATSVTDGLNIELEMLRKTLADESNPVNQLINLNTYINDQSQLRVMQGMDATTVNRSVQTALATVSQNFRSRPVLNMLLPAYAKGNNTEFMQGLYNKTINNIRKDQNNEHTAWDKRRTEIKDQNETKLLRSFIKNIPRNDDGTIDHTQLKSFVLQYKSIALEQDLDIQSRLDNFVTTLETTKGIPTKDFEDILHGLWDEHNPTESFKRIEREIFKNSIDPTKVTKYDFYKKSEEQHKSFPEGFFKNTFSDVRQRLAKIFASKGKAIQDSDGRWYIDDAAESAQLTEAISKVQAYWENNGHLQTTQSDNEFTESIRSFIEEHIIKPNQTAKNQQAGKNQNSVIVSRVLNELGVDNLYELEKEHSEQKQEIRGKRQKLQNVLSLAGLGLEDVPEWVLPNTDFHNYWKENVNKESFPTPAHYYKYLIILAESSPAASKQKLDPYTFRKDNIVEGVSLPPVPKLTVENLEPSTTSPAQLEEITERGDDFMVEGQPVEPSDVFLEKELAKSKANEEEREKKFQEMLDDKNTKSIKIGAGLWTEADKKLYQESLKEKKQDNVKADKRYRKAFRKDFIE